MTSDRSIRGRSPVVVIAAVWAALLAALFLAARGSDLGELPRLLGPWLKATLSFPKLDPAAPAHCLAGLLTALLILLSWYGLGHYLVKLAGEPEEPVSLRWARKGAYGAGVWSLVWFFLGVAGLYRKSVAAGALFVGLALFALSWRKGRRPAEVATNSDGRGAFALLAVLGLLTLLAALAPPTAKDALLYHLALPKLYVKAGGFTEAPGNIASFLPLGAEMQNIWAMLLASFFGERASETAALAVAFVFAPLLTLTVYGWARAEGLGREWAAAAAALMAAVPTAFYVAANAYIDLALALYIALATYALGRWWVRPEPRQLIHLALPLGFALALKLTALFAFFPLTLVILWRARETQRGGLPHSRTLLLSGAAALLGAVILASPWYLRTWARTGSPVFPFYLNIWPGHAPGWDAERSLLFQEVNARYGGYPKSALDYLGAPVRLSLTAQPEEPAAFDGVLGISFLFGLPFILWAIYRGVPLREELWVAVFTSVVLYLCWLFSSQQLRYLLPALPALAVATAAVLPALLAENSSPRALLLRRILLLTCLPGALVIIAWFVRQNPLPVLLGSETREEYLSRRLDYYPYYHFINRQLPPEARVWLINLRRDTYHLDRPYFSDYMFEDYTISRLVWEARDLDDLRRRAKEMGVTHILVRHDVLLDFNRSPVVDERRSLEENESRMKLLRDFLTATPPLRGDQKFYLIALTEGGL